MPENLKINVSDSAVGILRKIALSRLIPVEILAKEILETEAGKSDAEKSCTPEAITGDLGTHSDRLIRRVLALAALTPSAHGGGDARARSIAEIVEGTGVSSVTVRKAIARLRATGDVSGGWYRRTRTAPAEGFATTIRGLMRSTVDPGLSEEDRAAVAGLIDDVVAKKVTL
jgi:hypothetical protein